MKHVPKYLLPRIAPVSGGGDNNNAGYDDESSKPEGFVPFKKNSARGRGRGRGRGRNAGGRGGKKKSDPLKKFGR